MTAPVLETRPAPPPPPRRRRAWVAIAVVASVVVAGLVALVATVTVFRAADSRSVPTFATLTATPDPSLHGTVAYYASDTGCIRLVAAAGRPSKDLWCLPAESTATWVKLGKPVGPQLVWLPGDRLEVTMFRMAKGSLGGKGAPNLTPGWQKVVDVRTGSVRAVPAADVPTAPDATTQPTVAPNGDRVGYTANGMSGEVRVTLTTSAGTRTLLSTRGPGKYGYHFGPVFWAPNWQWVAAADDGRILVITTGPHPVTRVLVNGAGGGAGGGTAGPDFAVTTANLLTGPATRADVALRAALDAHDMTGLTAYFASSVDYAVAASGAFGTTSPTDAVRRISSYFDTARAPWNFAIPVTTLATHKSGSYHRYLVDDTYFGESANGFFVSIRTNRAGKIDQVFMAASTALLK